MSKAFLKHANCLYVTRNSKRNRQQDDDDNDADGDGDGNGDADGDEDEAAHPKHKEEIR